MIMFNRAMQKRRSGEEGFTLIELLIVIIILGILAAIVVFAIGGLTGESQKAACAADAKTLETAEDAYFAINGGYVAEATLKTANLIKENSTLYDVAATGGGTGYDINPQGGKCTVNPPAYP